MTFFVKGSSKVSRVTLCKARDRDDNDFLAASLVPSCLFLIVPSVLIRTKTPC